MAVRVHITIFSFYKQFFINFNVQKYMKGIKWNAKDSFGSKVTQRLVLGGILELRP